MKGTSSSLHDVQAVLLSFINADTILIGHGLENDLASLKVSSNAMLSRFLGHFYNWNYNVTFQHYELGIDFYPQVCSFNWSLLRITFLVVLPSSDYSQQCD